MAEGWRNGRVELHQSAKFTQWVETMRQVASLLYYNDLRPNEKLTAQNIGSIFVHPEET